MVCSLSRFTNIYKKLTLVHCFRLLEAVSCLLKAIEIYTDLGRFTIAAKHHQTIAEIYESELADLDRAVQHYEQAADYFKGTVKSCDSFLVLFIILFHFRRGKQQFS